MTPLAAEALRPPLLARVKGDYVSGDLTAGEWRELRGDLQPEAAAAGEDLGRALDRLHALEAGTRVSASEEDFRIGLERIRAAIVAGHEVAADVARVRLSLMALFEGFILGIDRGRDPAQAHWIEPVIAGLQDHPDGEGVRASRIRL